MRCEEPWFQSVVFRFEPFSEFERLDNGILNELMQMSNRVRGEPIAYVALTVAFIEKYLDVVVRWYAHKNGLKLHNILKPHEPASEFHKFRKAAVAEKLVSENFGELARKIYDMRDKMIHVDEEQLGAIGAITWAVKSETPSDNGKMTKIDYETIQRPLRKVNPSEKLKTVLDGIQRYQAIVDIYFANMVHEIRVLKVLDYEV